MCCGCGRLRQADKPNYGLHRNFVRAYGERTGWNVIA